MRLFPDSIAGRTILVLLVGLTLSHLVSIGTYQNDLWTELGLSSNHHLSDRIASISHAVSEQPITNRESTAHSLSSRTLQAHWHDSAPIDFGHGEKLTELEQRIRQTLPEDLANASYLVNASAASTGHGNGAIRIVVQLSENSWLSFTAETPDQHPANSHHLLTSTTLMALAVILFSIISVRILTAPLRKLSQAAERLGTDMAAPPLAESGPREVRQAARAFNGMQDRIKRLISDRMQMLAAISHDLRTPITRLRLRAEFVEDEAQRRKMLEDLSEMEAMIASVLAFIRDDAAKEDTKSVDVSSVLETICSDMTDAGHKVQFERDEQVVLRCRPLALKRALTNLIDNAIKYGQSATVALTSEPMGIRIDIDDEGPGIPQALREKAFSPFYRLETSRNRMTGGAGLGLTVARSIIRAHGGEIELSDNPNGGLRATIRLPQIVPS